MGKFIKIAIAGILLLNIPLLANAETYEDVKYLFQKAFEVNKNIKNENQRERLFSVIIENAVRNGDFDFAKEILPFVEHDIYKAEVNARIARGYAGNINCENAKKYIRKANSRPLQKTLKSRNHHFRAHIALNNLLEASAFCGKLELAEQFIDLPRVQLLGKKQYLAHANSLVGSALSRSGEDEKSDEYFKKALDIATPLKNETRRSSALSRIAKNQLIANLFDDALNTANKITRTEDRPKGLAQPFYIYRDLLLRALSREYARQGDVDKAYALVNDMTQEDHKYRQEFVNELIRSIISLRKEGTLKSLQELEEQLETPYRDEALIPLALAYYKIGKKKDAERILNGVYERNSDALNEVKGAFNTHRVNRLKHKSIQSFIEIDMYEKGLVLIKKEFVPSSEGSFKVKDFPLSLQEAWGAFVAVATLNNNEGLLNQIRTATNAYSEKDFIKFYSFAYLVDKGEFSLAEKVADSMSESNKRSPYIRIANQRMGISYEETLRDPRWRKR